jgi:hypothetical protein
MYFWYHYALRIYNRFYWNQHKTDWDDEDDEERDLTDLDPNQNISRLHKNMAASDGETKGARRKESGAVQSGKPPPPASTSMLQWAKESMGVAMSSDPKAGVFSSR